MRNVMLKAIPKSAFTRMVIEATNAFREIHSNGLPVSSSGSACNIDGIKDAIADSSIDGKLKKAWLDLIAASIGAAKKTTRKPSADELAKQFLTFVPYAAVVPLRNRNHHAYTIGKPVIMVHGNEGADSEMFGMDYRGCIINKSGTASDGLSHLPRLRKSLRPATNYEIGELVDELYS